MNTLHSINMPGTLFQSFPREVVAALRDVGDFLAVELYVSGGTLRDWMLGVQPADLDITVHHGATECCKKLQDILEGSTLIRLGTEDEEAARVVWRSTCIDFSSFRCGAKTIEEELRYRDFTVNALAVKLEDRGSTSASEIIDPLGGRNDLQKGILRSCRDAFVHDPLRMLRGYRLQAEFGLVMDDHCRRQITRHADLLRRCAAERIHSEFDRIMMNGAAPQIVREMASSGLLWQVAPELALGVGVEQPGYHHEDVFHHSLLALDNVEMVMAGPRNYFGRHAEIVERYLENARHRKRLRWSALFHDLGKPASRGVDQEKNGRITFYSHDLTGAEKFSLLARQLRMGNSDRETIAKLIEMHMHPFHLSNVRRREALSRKALVKICKKAGEDLPGLFVLAMADSLAGQGEMKPVDMEDELALLFDEVVEVRKKHIEPVVCGQRLITGHDLIDTFGLEPGPRFRVILEELEIARIEGEVADRPEAFEWVRKYLEAEERGGAADPE